MKKAAAYEMFSCGDPKCGPHLVGFDEHGVPICEIVIAAPALPGLIRSMQNLLYEKLAMKDDDAP